ncbi:MAG: CvpA family protein [Fretibacterium sp.]|nr:CvpA family protein [Fretibacterium sp.]
MSVGLIFDIAVAVVLAFFAVRGLIRGFSGEILGLIGFCASLFCAWSFARPAADFILGYFPKLDATLAALACAVAIFIAVSLVFALLDGLLSLIVQAANLSMLDHLLGAVVGVAKTCCLLLFIYGLLNAFPALLPTGWMGESYAMRGAAEVWPPVMDFLEGHGIINLRALGGSGGSLPPSQIQSGAR